MSQASQGLSLNTDAPVSVHLQGHDAGAEFRLPDSYADALRCISGHRPVILKKDPETNADKTEVYLVDRVAVGLGSECFHAHVCEARNQLRPTPPPAIAAWQVALQQCVGLDPAQSALSMERPVITFIQRASSSHRCASPQVAAGDSWVIEMLRA